MTSWAEKIKAGPDHSNWYVSRMRGLAADGEDLGGEARLVAALAKPGSKVLDAGCGPGRVSHALEGLGLNPTGVDLDPILIDAAREDYPDIQFEVADLTAAPAEVIDRLPKPFDAVISCGNVLPFMEPGTQATALKTLAQLTRKGGRLALGFGTDRGYSVEECLTDAEAAGWRLDGRFSTWNLAPQDDDPGFFVGIFTRRS